MSGLLPDDEIRNPGAGDPWLKSERDKALDEYFIGAHPKKLGRKYKGSPKAFLNSILNKLRYNYKKKGHEDQPGRAERYEPFRRVSRKGLRFTPNEIDFIRCHKEKCNPPMPLQVTAKILCRDVSELDDSYKEIPATKANEVFAPTLDQVLAHRYIFHVYKCRVISDKTFDELAEEEIKYGGGRKALTEISRDGFWGPKRIKSLALYLVEKYEDEHGKPPERIKVVRK
jgi:hypothetical protein